MTIREHVQRSALGAKVTLFEIDLTEWDLGIVRITPATDGAAAVSFGGEVYAPHPIKSEGWELTTNDSMPRPGITVANVDNSFTALVDGNDDLHGAIVRRIRTYDRYLDSGAEPDGDSHLPIDVYQISQKTQHDDEQITWRLTALMDQEDVSLPARQVVRDYCSHTTRRWTGVAFDYTGVTCPYVGAAKDVNGVACASADEVFSKRLKTCCIARFGENAVLPTRAFPGVARIRAR